MSEEAKKKPDYEEVWKMSGQELLDEAEDIFKALMKKVKELVEQGNSCRVRLENEQGKVLFQTTVTAGAAGALVLVLLTPLLITIATLAAVIAHCSLKIEKEVQPPAEKSAEGAAKSSRDNGNLRVKSNLHSFILLI